MYSNGKIVNTSCISSIQYVDVFVFSALGNNIHTREYIQEILCATAVLKRGNNGISTALILDEWHMSALSAIVGKQIHAEKFSQENKGILSTLYDTMLPFFFYRGFRIEGISTCYC